MASCKGEPNRLLEQRASRFVPGWRLCLGLMMALISSTGGRGASVLVLPDADTFTRAAAPTNNYGAGGGLSVAGAASANGTGQQNGAFDTLIRFPGSNVVAALDAELGGHDWLVIGARLYVTEMAAPDNPMFNKGVGAFEIRWIAEDGWIEGTGKPAMPTSDGVTWQDLPAILNSNVERSLGTFTNAGIDGQESFALATPQGFVADLRSGGS